MADAKKLLSGLDKVGKRLLASRDAEEGGLNAIRAAGRIAHEQEAAARAARNAQVKEQMANLPARNKKANEALGLYHPVGGGIKLSRPTSGMNATTVADPKFNPPDIKDITPEQLVKEGAALFPLVGDRAAAGRYLTHVGENELEEAVRLTGGPRYMDANYNALNPEDSAAWESGAGRVTSLGNQAARAGEDGRPVYGIYTAGSGTNTDFNIMGANALIQQIPFSKISKKDEKLFDLAMRSGSEDFPAIPDWPGIRSPQAREMLLDKSNGIARTKLFGTMGLADFQARGFPDVPATRKAIIEPELLDIPTNQAGFRMARMDTKGRIIEDPIIPSDYPKAMAGQVAGKLDVPADYKDVFQTHFDARRLLSKPESGDYYSFSRAHPIQYADDNWLNRLMEKRLADERKIKEGEYKEGGEVEEASLEDRLTKAIGAHMASGGKADSMESRLTKAISTHMAGGGEAFKKLEFMAEGGGAFKKLEFMADGGKAGKFGKLAEGVATIGKKLLDNGEAAPKVDRLSMSYKDVTKRVPEVADALEQLMRGEITKAQYNDVVKMYKPVTPYAFVPKPASKEEAVDALRGDAAKSRYGMQSEYEPGSKVGLRLDIPAYTGKGVWVNSIHNEKAKKVAYGPTASVKNADLGISQSESKRIALGGAKAPYARIKGEWNPMSEEEAIAKAQEYLNHPEWRQIGIDPERHSYFYDRATMQPITNAEEVIQIGPLVLGKNPKYGKMEDFEYADGGKIIKGGLNIARRLFKTTDGYTFKEMPDGSVTNGDMTWPNVKEFKQEMPHAYQQGDQLGQRRANMESYSRPDPQNIPADIGRSMPDDAYAQFLRAYNKQNAPKPQLSVVPSEKKAEGGGAFKTLQFKDAQHFDGGGAAVDLSESGPLFTKKELETIRRNAPEVYEWAKQNVKDEANQLRSVKGAKDFGLRVGAQYAGAIPDLVNLGLMIPDAFAGTKLSSEKPWFGSEQIIEAMHKAGMLGENEFPVAETVAGVLAPAGLIKKGVKKGYQAYENWTPKTPKKRRGGLAAMSR